MSVVVLSNTTLAQEAQPITLLPTSMSRTLSGVAPPERTRLTSARFADASRAGTTTEGITMMKKLLAVLTALALAFGVSASAASAHPTPEPDCAGETYAVVSAPGDMAMAELVASWQVLDTHCVVEPDDAEASVSVSQQTVVLGGTKAVPESAVDGLNVIVRLAGADRVATAETVIAWIDRRASGNLATIARTEAEAAAPGAQAAQAITDSKVTFTVGKDIRAGLWRFSESSGEFSAGSNTLSSGGAGGDIAGYAGDSCLYRGDGRWYFGVNVNDGMSDVLGVGPWSGSVLRLNVPFDTFVFLLNEGDTVSLWAKPDTVCEIEWHGSI